VFSYLRVISRTANEIQAELALGKWSGKSALNALAESGIQLEQRDGATTPAQE
jgi:hypothetical protein